MQGASTTPRDSSDDIARTIPHARFSKTVLKREANVSQVETLSLFSPVSSRGGVRSVFSSVPPQPQKKKKNGANLRFNKMADEMAVLTNIINGQSRTFNEPRIASHTPSPSYTPNLPSKATKRLSTSFTPRPQFAFKNVFPTPVTHTAESTTPFNKLDPTSSPFDSPVIDNNSIQTQNEDQMQFDSSNHQTTQQPIPSFQRAQSYSLHSSFPLSRSNSSSSSSYSLQLSPTPNNVSASLDNMPSPTNTTTTTAITTKTISMKPKNKWGTRVSQHSRPLPSQQPTSPTNYQNYHDGTPNKIPRYSSPSPLPSPSYPPPPSSRHHHIKDEYIEPTSDQTPFQWQQQQQQQHTPLSHQQLFFAANEENTTTRNFSSSSLATSSAFFQSPQFLRIQAQVQRHHSSKKKGEDSVMVLERDVSDDGVFGCGYGGKNEGMTVALAGVKPIGMRPMSSVYVSPSMRMSENHLIFDDEDEDDNENEYDDGDENVNELRYNADRRGGGLEKFEEEDWEVSSPLLGVKPFQRNAMRQENSNGGDDTMNMDNGLDQMQCDGGNYGSESGETEEEAKERISLDIWNSVDELGGESTGKSTDVGVNQTDVGEWFVGDGGEEENWF